jgi:hypothetical protein
VRLNEVYQEQYRATKEKLAAQPGHKQFDFVEHNIFFKFDLFSKRLHKLIDMFSTMHQFSSLAMHTHIDGLDQVGGLACAHTHACWHAHTMMACTHPHALLLWRGHVLWPVPVARHA